MKRWLTNAAIDVASWTLARVADVLLGRAVTADPWPATTEVRRENYPPGIEGLETMQRELNLQRELRRIHVQRLEGDCPSCGPVCLCARKGSAGGWRF